MLETFLKNFKHKLYIYWWSIKKPQTHLDFLASAYLSLCARWTGEIQPVLTYVGMFDTLRRLEFQGTILELGGGYSTILAANHLNISPKSLTSVDVNPQKYDRILNSRRAAEKFLSSIDNISMLTIRFEEIDIALSEIMLFLDSMDIQIVNAALSSFGYEKSFEPSELINSFKQHQSFSEELKFYENNSSGGQKYFCTDFVGRCTEFDAYFFDCGEISSIAEFCLLEKIMSKGNFVLLHDIMYPKSIKNFLVATYVVVSEHWEVLYLDRQTPQGGLVARKVS